MRKILAFVAFCLISSSMLFGQNSPVKKQLEFYSMNYAFVGMKLEVVTPGGKVYSQTWEATGYNYWLKTAETKNIKFPVDGRNCKVRISFKTANGDTSVTHFLLNDYDYSGHPLYVMISGYNLAPKMTSNFGPGQYGTRLINQWSYPEDDYAIHPHIKRDTPAAKKIAFQIARLSKYIRQAINKL